MMRPLTPWNPLTTPMPPPGEHLFELTGDIFAVPAGSCPAPFTNHEAWHNSLISLMGGREDATFLLATRNAMAMGERLLEWERQASSCLPGNILPTLKASTQAELDKQILGLVVNPVGETHVLLLEPTEGIIVQGEGDYLNKRALNSRRYLRVLDGDTPIAWVIVRGQAGETAKPLHPQWVRDLRNQAWGARSKFTFFGWGEWLPISQAKPGDEKGVPSTSVWPRDVGNREDLPLLAYRVGAAHSGALLDEEVEDDRPEIAQ